MTTVFSTPSKSINGTLAGTTALTTLTNDIASKVLNILQAADDSETIKTSTHDMQLLDSLVVEHGELNEVDTSFLSELSEATLSSMLKSQQSKRSRCKAKDMTVENYKSMMAATAAEYLIRSVLGKTKGNNGRTATDALYTEERLAQLASDQEALRKEIRNVQSKKSIAKSKADHSETSDRWVFLCAIEQQLKEIRLDAAPTKVIVQEDPAIATLREMLAEVQIDSIKLKDAKQLLQALVDVVFPAEEEIAEEEQPAEEIVEESQPEEENADEAQ